MDEFIRYAQPGVVMCPANPAKGFGGYDQGARKFTPLHMLGVSMHEALDAITLAIEDEVVLREGWASQMFATVADLDVFLLLLENFETVDRLHDRWWHALRHLAHGGYDWPPDSGHISSSEIAQALRDNLKTTDQLETDQ